jgi:hypothetical protein
MACGTGLLPGSVDQDTHDALSAHGGSIRVATRVREPVSSCATPRPAGPRRVEVGCHPAEAVPACRRSSATPRARRTCLGIDAQPSATNVAASGRWELARGTGTGNWHRELAPVGASHQLHKTPSNTEVLTGFGVTNGSGEIRTLGTLSRTHTFQACALNHSATDPGATGRILAALNDRARCRRDPPPSALIFMQSGVPRRAG